MSEKFEGRNIWTNFTKELGYTTASIQYVELSLRIASKQFNDELKSKNIVELAKRYSLSVSEIPEDFSLRIVKNYIVQIHSCIELFLINYQNLIGSATNGLNYDNKNDNRLHWTLTHVFGDMDSDYSQMYRICDYYRHVRNLIVHQKNDSSGYRNARGLISNYQDDKLQAPNSIENLNFDDQVLYARCARKLLKEVYVKTHYDWAAIVSAYQTQIKQITVKRCDDAIKRNTRIENFLKRIYPVSKSNIDDIISVL